MKLNEAQVQELKAWLDNGDCPDWLQDYAASHWAEDIPYGTLTGDDATIDEWLCDHEDYVRDEFSEYLI